MSEKAKVFITGCGGMLGEAIYSAFSKEYEVKATDIDVNEPWLSYLDVRDYDAVKKAIEEYKPQLILHFAALTDLEYCESNPDEAYMTNTIGTENVASIAKELDVPLVYTSSAGIYDGKKSFYDDFDEPNPINHYGRSKYTAEYYVKTNLNRYFVIRPGWMMGGGKKDKKFVAKILKQVQSGKKEISAISNIYGRPTYTYDLAKTLLALVKTKHYGVYNIACKGDIPSRYDVAAEILKHAGLSDKIKLISVDESHFKKEYFTPRPVSEALENKKLDLRKLNFMRDWRECVKDYMENHWKDEV